MGQPKCMKVTVATSFISHFGGSFGTVASRKIDLNILPLTQMLKGTQRDFKSKDKVFSLDMNLSWILFTY